MGRPPCCESDGLKRGSWDPEEDQILVSHIQKYGHSNWKTLPKLAGLQRCGKSCRLRWLNYLRPDIKRGNFTREEEDAIIHLHQILGNRWSVIAARLPGRTDNEIKNVWHTHLKKRLARNSSSVSHSNRAQKRGGGDGGGSSSNHVTLATTSSTVLSSSYNSSPASTLPSPSSDTAASAGYGEIGGFDGNDITVDEYFLDDTVLPWLEECESGGWSTESMQQNNREEQADDFWLRLLMEVEASADSHHQFPIDHLLFA